MNLKKNLIGAALAALGLIAAPAVQAQNATAPTPQETVSGDIGFGVIFDAAQLGGILAASGSVVDENSRFSTRIDVRRYLNASVNDGNLNLLFSNVRYSRFFPKKAINFYAAITPVIADVPDNGEPPVAFSFFESGVTFRLGKKGILGKSRLLLVLDYLENGPDNFEEFTQSRIVYNFRNKAFSLDAGLIAGGLAQGGPPAPTVKFSVNGIFDGRFGVEYTGGYEVSTGDISDFVRISYDRQILRKVFKDARANISWASGVQENFIPEVNGLNGVLIFNLP
ncbi:MAG: hypothetical protein AAFQ80_11670 [Cyanobacteria bacterium J06621_8]